MKRFSEDILYFSTSGTINCNFKMEISKSLMNWPILCMLEPEFILNIDMVVVHGTLCHEALIVTKDKMVYALGKNKDGCSGTGIEVSNSLLAPTKVSTLCEMNIKTFAHGRSSHVLALTEDGKVYSWGNNKYYQLGTTRSNTNSSLLPNLVEENLRNTFVVDIACGNYQSMALTVDGEVYEWGQNNHIQYPRRCKMPSKVKFTFDGKRIVCISCGNSHSMAVTADGEVYGWGNNDFGQLGIGNDIEEVEPCKIKNLTGIVIEKVVCGSMYTLALSNKGILYTWGDNTYGQLGSSKCTKVCRPEQLEMPLTERVLDIAASHYNSISVAMGEGNCVFVWGHCLRQCINIPMLTPYRCLYDALACYASPTVMHKPFLLHGKGRTNLRDCLEGAFDDPTTSDLVIRVEGSFIYVHKTILKMRSQYFRTMFQEHWAENNQSVIEHEKFCYDVYRAFLEYLYTDKINVLVEDALEFLDLTNAYLESQLQSRWILLIKKDITVRNVISLYNAAVQYNAKELEEYCFQFAINHMPAVARRPSFSKLDELVKTFFTIEAVNAGASKTVVQTYQNFKTTRRSLMKWRIIRSLEPQFISKIHMVMVHGDSGCSALIVMKDGIVYGLGLNKSGCLGTGDTRSTLCPTEVKALSGKGIKTFAYRCDQTLALTEKGEVYSWRTNISCSSPGDSQGSTPTLMEGYPSETFVVDIACGKYHSLALTNDGKVYTLGENMYVEVVRASPLNEIHEVILPHKKIVYIRCGAASNVAVTNMGEVYSWGCNTGGELGRGNCKPVIGVHKVQIPTGVVIEKLACGYAHTLAVSNEGVLYAWGANTFGQLGLGYTGSCSTPVKLQEGEMGKVLDVAASPSHCTSVAMCEHNRVFVWGQCLHQSFLVRPTRTSFECLHDAFGYQTAYSAMHQPLIVSSEEEMSITDNLREAFDDEATSDLTIHVGGKPIYVHKAILKIRCQYFRLIFGKECGENEQSLVEPEQFGYDVYRAFVEYLYTDQIYLPAESIHELLDLAITYSDSVLRDRCIPLSKSGIKIGNVASIYGVSIKHGLKELEQVSFDFAMKHLTAVVHTPDFAKLDAFTTRSLMIKAVDTRAFKT